MLLQIASYQVKLDIALVSIMAGHLRTVAKVTHSLIHCRRKTLIHHSHDIEKYEPRPVFFGLTLLY